MGVAPQLAEQLFLVKFVPVKVTYPMIPEHCVSIQGASSLSMPLFQDVLLASHSIPEVLQPLDPSANQELVKQTILPLNRVAGDPATSMNSMIGNELVGSTASKQDTPHHPPKPSAPLCQLLYLSLP